MAQCNKAAESRTTLRKTSRHGAVIANRHLAQLPIFGGAMFSGQADVVAQVTGKIIRPQPGDPLSPQQSAQN